MSPNRDEEVLDPGAVDRLLRIGGQDFLIEMIDLFLEHAPRRLEAARAAYGESDFQTLYRAAHSLKSTAGNLGARPLQAVAERVEGLAAAEDGEEIPPLLDDMERRYEQVRAELQAERERRKGAVT